jgi:hypothetical protein
LGGAFFEARSWSLSILVNKFNTTFLKSYAHSIQAFGIRSARTTLEVDNGLPRNPRSIGEIALIPSEHRAGAAALFASESLVSQGSIFLIDEFRSI